MSEFYFSRSLGDARTLCVAPLSDRRIESSGQDVPDTSGYFLFETRGFDNDTEVEIIAQAMSEEAAFRLREMLGLS